MNSYIHFTIFHRTDTAGRCCTQTADVTSTDVMPQMTQLSLQPCPVEVQCAVRSTLTILQAGQLIAISKGFLLIVIGRDAQAGVPLAQYHLAAGAERCSVDSASALSCPLEARGEGSSCRTSRGIWRLKWTIFYKNRFLPCIKHAVYPLQKSDSKMQRNSHV